MVKPKNLKAPFSFKERRPLIQDGVLYVPPYFEEHGPKLDWKEVFGNENRVHIEYCSGNGEWIIRKALENPDINWVAVEVQFDRVRKIFSKRHNERIDNLFIVCGEALTFTRYYVPDNSVEQTYVNFPDPWPKKRHAKHRLIKAPFPREVMRITNKMLLVTDDLTYFSQMKNEMEPFWKCQESFNEEYGLSFFKRLWNEKGKTIHFLRCQNEMVRVDISPSSDLEWKKVDAPFWYLDCRFGNLSDELTYNTLVHGIRHFVETLYNGSPICLYAGPLRSDELGEYVQMLASKLPEEATVYALFDHSTSPSRRAYQLSPEWFGYVKTSLREDNATTGIVLPIECPEELFDEIDSMAEGKRIIPEKFLTELWDGLEELIAFEEYISPQGMRKLKGFEAAMGSIDIKSFSRHN